MIYNIQFGRAVAALLVVFAHIEVPGLTFGHFGVDIFFVISGFIMTMICERGPAHFFPRRLVRIVPLYWLITSAVFVLCLVRPQWLNSTTPNAVNFLKSIFFLPYVKENGTVHPMLDVGWTLNYEMYFYAVIALTLCFTRPRFATLAAVGIMFVVQAICFFAAAQIHDPNSMLGTLTRFYSTFLIEEFIFGVLIYHLTQRLGRVRAHPAIFIILATACLIYLACHQLRLIGPANPLLSIAVPSAIFVLCLVLLEHEKFVITKLTLLGDASYALYLTNQFVVEGYRKIGSRIFHVPIFSVPGCLLVMLAAALVSIMIFKFIEKPMHDGLRKYV